MKDNRILASVALFSELYDLNKDVFHLVGEFIRSALTTERVDQFNSGDVSALLSKHFDFQLPIAVLRTVIRTRLKREGFCRSNGHDSYAIVNPDDGEADKLNEEYTKLQGNYEAIVAKLIDYAQNHLSGEKPVDEEELKKAFHSFLLGDGGIQEEYVRICSAFIVDHSSAPDITEAVNQIREGLVIYSGIESAQQLNELGVWKQNLNIILDTELLLDMGGFNGVVYREIFEDFHRLVKEVNNANETKKVRARISLSYLEDSRKQVERIFNKAERVLSGSDSVQMMTTAFRAIMEGCKTPSDVLTKKVVFFNRLEIEGIQQIDEGPLHETIQFNVESQELIDSIPGELKLSRQYSDDDVHQVLRQFTAINKIRRGVTGTTLESCGSVLLTRDRFTRTVGSNPSVKFHPRDYQFAVDIDQVINRLWFNLNKGFTDKSALPRTFDMVTRSQIVLASQVRISVTQRYYEVLRKKENGEITDKDALELFAELRNKEVEAAKIDEAALDEILEFICDSNIQAQIDELTAIKQTAAEVPTLKSQLDATARDLENTLSQNRRLVAEKFQKLRRQNTRIRFYVHVVSIAALVVLPLLLGGAIYLLIRLLKSDQDSTLSIVLGLLGILLSLGSLIKYRKPVQLLVRQRLSSVYRQRKKKIRLRGPLRLR